MKLKSIKSELKLIKMRLYYSTSFSNCVFLYLSLHLFVRTFYESMQKYKIINIMQICDTCGTSVK